MATKSKQRGVRLSESHEQYVMESGEKLHFPSLMGNTPRVSGIRTAGDKEFLKSNDGKMSILQH